jgi:hypothetical protein
MKDLTDLYLFYKREDIIRQTAAQIIKDFGYFNIEIEFSGKVENAYFELFQQLEPSIESLLKGNRQKFMNMLYKIDISETQLKNATNANKKKSLSNIVCELVIKRELQKVVIRNYYSDKKQLD